MRWRSGLRSEVSRARLKLATQPELVDLYHVLIEEWHHLGRPASSTMPLRWRVDAGLLQLEFDRRGYQPALF
jgi:hypothetical protein